MSSPPPTKPPRGIKQGKETSGLLMSVIRTLSASETNEQRDREKAKLEKEYKKSDQRLDELVAIHANELTKVMNVFSTSCAAVNVCRTRLLGAKARLVACRGLLRVKRDDLRRLWFNARQHKYALDMLSQIESLVAVEKEVSKHISEGHLLNAATVLQGAMVLANTALAQVEALLPLRAELKSKKDTLVEKTTNALSEAVYKTEIANLKRQGSTRDRIQSSTLSIVISEITKFKKVAEDSLHDINTEFELSLTNEDKSIKVTMAILIESLAVLNKIKESTEKFKVQIQTELLQIIATLSQQVIEFGATQTNTLNGPTEDYLAIENDSSHIEDNIDPQYQLLIELLMALLESCRIIATRQKIMLELWKQTITKHKTDNIQLYTMQHYWNSVQSVLQLLLTDYLDIQNLTLNSQRINYTEEDTSTDINIYFPTKKNPPTKKKNRLFKFNNSSKAEDHKLSASSSSLESAKGKPYQLVCLPSPDNLAYIYHILESFMNEIETNCGGNECSLRAFIWNHIRTAEVERLAALTKAAVESACTESSAWREVCVPPQPCSNNLTIFSCAVNAWRSVERVARVSRRLAAAAGTLLAGAARPALGALAAAARHAHLHLLGRAPPARSVAWLKDDDIVRFHKSLPNWHNLKIPPAKRKTPSHLLEQEMKQGFEREAEILGSSLGDGTVSQKEIISNNNTLRDIALMCETMDWLYQQTRMLPASITSSGAPVKLGDRALGEIASAATSFEELSDTCLLQLHLELRIQCFHYLGQEDSVSSVSFGGRGGGDMPGALAAESGAAKLAAAIKTFHEDASTILQPSKLNYIMQGLGEMMSAAVVGGCQAGGAAGGAAAHAQRLATLRHCLAAAALPADGLHRAALYLDMLTMSPEEILKMVKEKGPQFSELEYLNAFNLIGKARHQSDAEMKIYLNKLSHILGNVGVTV